MQEALALNVMKTWISYLAALFMGLATVLLLGDTLWFLPVISCFHSIALSAGTILSLLMIIFSLTGAVASLCKDRAGGKLVSSSLIWGLVCAILLPMVSAMLCVAFPTVFPVSSTAGGGSVSPTYLASVFKDAFNITFSGNMASYLLYAAADFIIPVIILAFVIGLALRPTADVIKPAYITINSFSEVMFRLARTLNVFGFIFIYFTSCYTFTVVYQEKTFFVNARFSLLMLAIPLILALGVLPLLFAIFTRGRKNPYKSIYRNLASELAAFTSGNYIFTMPFLMAGERHNDGVQKRIAVSSTSLYCIIGRGGSAAVATFALLCVITNVTGTPVSANVAAIIALCATLASFASCISRGFEIMFIVVAAMKLCNINLYSAEITILGLFPLLSGLGCLLDCIIAVLGATIASKKLGVDLTPPYEDIL